MEDLEVELSILENIETLSNITVSSVRNVPSSLKGGVHRDEEDCRSGTIEVLNTLNSA